MLNPDLLYNHRYPCQAVGGCDRAALYDTGCLRQATHELRAHMPIMACTEHKKAEFIEYTGTPHKCGASREGNPRFCAQHNVPGTLQRTCEHDGCTAFPMFAFEPGTAYFCEAHKLPNMFDVVAVAKTKGLVCMHANCYRKTHISYPPYNEHLCFPHYHDTLE